MKRFDAGRAEFSPYGFTCEVWVPSRMPQPDNHNEVEMNFLSAGSLTYLLGGRRVTIEAGRVAAFWAAIPHQIVAFEGFEPYHVVTLPLSEFLTIGVPVGVVNRMLKGEMLIDSADDPCDRLKFPRWAQELPLGEPACERAIRLEVQARLLRLAVTVGAGRGRQVPEPELSRADRIACYIARNYQKPLTAGLIAKANGLHPNYASALFRRAFSTTMTAFITQHRITHAQRLMVTTDKSILEVALAAGFQSLSRFNEAFKAACGHPPREYRKAHRNAGDGSR